MPFLPSTSPSIIIVGAGIGGLTTALQLHAHGITNIHIFESASTLATLGVGINVQPHAILILRNLGLLPALEATGIKTLELNYYDRFGSPIIQEPRGMHAGYEVPQFSIHRGEFQMLLLDTVKERLGADRIHLDHCFQSFTQDESAGTITATFIRRNDPANPPVVPSKTADLLIAADGINSTARRILYPNEGPPRFSGRILWRGCTERVPYLTGASMVWGGHANQKFIAYPISARSARKGHSLINWICELRVRGENDPDTTPPKTDWLATVPKERFAEPFAKWHIGELAVKDLIDETEKVFEFPMCDRDPVSRWTFGRLTLLGDAAHPMYPIGSNGASQAILDAECLTKHLLAHLPVPSSNTPMDIPTALLAYQNERLPATAKIVMANRANGPDHVMQVAYERAPNGFENIHDVIPKEELEEIGRQYKAIAGFDIESVNRKAVDTEGKAQRLGLQSPKAWVAMRRESATGVVPLIGRI
ncbi:FAD/NAD(P)-binding domain-containing protein [Trichodelitschia bisporula]|uniref:FAD/NAD(P)-binding domain-containing protein n=1 Tax=Trichodelitschia bisporula TaxID=703511 RepID=A0A6G1IAA1_9PEZI|nr:FAD/NAD(P)-binding domain-containing protein [Trichodelitschia bisporula]